MPQNLETIIYTDPSIQTTISDIVFFQDTIWMTQSQMNKLYETDASGISRHIKRIYADRELEEVVTSTTDSKLQKMQNTQSSFKRPKKYYNLQVVIAVGFKVNSPQAISFRTWANKIVEQYISQGYALDDERLKGGTTFGGKRDHEKLMERVRSIRFDERNIYEKIKDLFTTAVDYDKGAQYLEDKNTP